jgi:lipopolysaccharide/colanic/teichoic acid biosynthesis glycosyltransferase
MILRELPQLPKSHAVNRPCSNLEPTGDVADRHHERSSVLHRGNTPATTSAPAKQGSLRPRQNWYLPLKGVFDFIIGLTLLVLLSPVIALAALCVKFTSRGPAFYLQTRVGRHGRPFRIIKLRSMRADAEAKTGAVWCAAHDDRITPIGLILRATHIDELPQLINVVKGDMSLVGPRPERPEFVQNFERQIAGYAGRLLVRPGITGLAQLRLPPDTDLESVRNKLEFDLYYVRHVGPWLDLVTVIMTGLNFFTSILRVAVPPSFRVPTQTVVREYAHALIRRDPTTDAPVHRDQPVVDAASGTMAIG